MQETLSAQRPDRFLLTAYPDERQRAHATRWLGWIAYHMGDSERLDWWLIPAWVPAEQILIARRIVVCVVFAALAGLAVAVTSWIWVIFILAFVGLSRVAPALVNGRGKRRGPVTLHPGPPCAIVPRWLRLRELGRLLGFSVSVVEKPAATAVSTYRAGRLTSVILGLVCTPVGALIGVLVLAPAYGSAGWRFGTLFFALGIGAFCGMMAGSYPLLKLTELVLATEWRERVSFLRLLEDAAKRGVVRHAGVGYEFGDDVLRAHLAVLGRPALADHEREQARRSARTRIRSKITAVLPARAISRVSRDLGVGVGIFIAAVVIIAARSQGDFRWLLGGLLGAVGGFFAARVVAEVLWGAIGGACWTLANISGWSRGVRLTAVAILGAAGGVLVAEAGTDLVKLVAVVLPAAFVAACGLWACVLTLRKVRKVSNRWLKFAPDVIAAATTCACLLMLVERNLLTTQPAAGLLFPPAIWGSILIWRAMSSSGHLAVKAGANIMLSLLLGAELVLLLVWLANLLGLPRPEVAALRALLDQSGSAADLPWWVWTGLYVLLAAAGLAFVRWPDRLTRLIHWFRRLHVVPAADVIRRVLTCVHISLLVIVLVGLDAPTALAPTFERQLKATYTVALQRELQAEGELAAYTEIRRQFTVVTTAPALAAIVLEIHDVGSPPSGNHDATRTETDLARRLGELQAVALTVKAPPSLHAAEQSAASQTGFGEPIRDASELSDRLSKLDEQERKNNGAAKRVEESGDLAAAAVASTISIPRISDNEVFQIVREYLSGLIEDSPLKDIFAAWTERLAGGSQPPDAATMVIPDPGRLEQAASAALSGEFTAEGLADPVTDPLVTDPAVARALGESPLVATVDLVNQARYLQENSGPCTGCTRPENPGRRPAELPEDHPVEPVIPG